MNKRILISGGSIAGPALAYWLHRYGFAPTVVEQAAGIREGGYAVDFRGVSVGVLDRMHVLGAVEDAQTHMGRIALVDRNGSGLAHLPDGLTTGQVEIMRGDLTRILRSHAQRYGVHFRRSIAAMSTSDEGVSVTFKSGMTRMFDLVVGADGLHSNVRALAFGDESQFLRHLGCYVSIFTTDNYLALDHAGAFHCEPGRVAGVFSARNNRAATATFYFAADPLVYDRYEIEQQKRIVRGLFSGMGWEVPRLLERMEDAPDFYFDSISQIKMSRWCTERTVLLGDAAYCGSPLSGMGSGMAVVGAYVLAGELKAAGGNHRLAYERYEAAMRSYVNECQKIADGAADWFIPQSRFRMWLMLQMYKLLPYTPWRNMMTDTAMKAAGGITLREYGSTDRESAATRS